MSAIADRLGVAIHWKDTGGFDNIIPGLKSGRYDVALANIDANKSASSRWTSSAITTLPNWP